MPQEEVVKPVTTKRQTQVSSHKRKTAPSGCASTSAKKDVKMYNWYTLPEWMRSLIGRMMPYFLTLHSNLEYWQKELDPQDREKIAFTGHHGS